MRATKLHIYELDLNQVIQTIPGNAIIKRETGSVEILTEQI